MPRRRRGGNQRLRRLVVRRTALGLQLQARLITYTRRWISPLTLPPSMPVARRSMQPGGLLTTSVFNRGRTGITCRSYYMTATIHLSTAMTRERSVSMAAGSSMALPNVGRYTETNSCRNSTSISTPTAVPQEVWTAGYRGVWHMREGPGVSNDIKDSTSNNNDGTSYNMAGSLTYSGKTCSSLREGFSGFSLPFFVSLFALCLPAGSYSYELSATSYQLARQCHSLPASSPCLKSFNTPLKYFYIILLPHKFS